MDELPSGGDNPDGDLPRAAGQWESSQHSTSPQLQEREREERGEAPPANPQDRKHGSRAAGYEEEEDGAPKNPKNRFSSATGTG